MGCCGDACTGCLKCSSVIGTVFLIILNTVFFLLGVAVLVVGILLKTNENINDNDVLNFLDNVVFGSFSLTDILQIIFIVVIVVGTFMILTAVTGGLGACFKLRYLLVGYSFIVIVCIGIEATILYFWIKIISGVNDVLLTELMKLMAKYEGPQGTDVLSLGWNIIFILFQCCGVTATTASNNDFEQSAWWKASNRYDVIPPTCCNGATKNNYELYTNVNCTQKWTEYHTAGCYDEFDSFLTGLAEAAIPIIGVTILVEVIAIVFSCLLCCAENRKKKVFAI